MPVAAAIRRCVRVEMRPEGGKSVGGATSPGGAGADAAVSVIAAESAPYEVLVGEGVCWTIAIGEMGASAEPVAPSEGKAKTKANAVSVAGKIAPRPGRRSTVVMAAHKRVTNLPEGAERSSIFIRGP